MQTKAKSSRIGAAASAPAWHVVDAEGMTLGRLCTSLATLLQGKHKPSYVPYMNTGDYVIVTNAEKIKVTGNKLDQKMYYRHSGYHGGLTEQKLSTVLAKSPTRVIKGAVKGMLPKTTPGRRMLSRLKVYAGETHPHEAQLNAGRKARATAEKAEQDIEEA